MKTNKEVVVHVVTSINPPPFKREIEELLINLALVCRYPEALQEKKSKSSILVGCDTLNFIEHKYPPYIHQYESIQGLSGFEMHPAHEP
jgi:hypothetical protein